MSENELEHYGILRRSGRYPYGSGDNPFQGGGSFVGYYRALKAQGLTDAQIAEGLGTKSTELRRQLRIARNEQRAADQAQAVRLKEKGYSNTAIGQVMGRNESSVRGLLKASETQKSDVVEVTTQALMDEFKSKNYLDIGKGTETQLGISTETLMTAVQALKNEGYEQMYVKVKQLGTGEMTNVRVLAKPGSDYKTVAQNPEQIGVLERFSEDRGLTVKEIPQPKKIAPSRVEVRYGPDGGADMDGVLEVRRGAKDLSLGNATYAQVRLLVGEGQYLKGMAVYSDNLPDGVDIRFNTNKKDTGNKLDAMKSVKDDPDNPFGSANRPKTYIDENGKEQYSAFRIVNEEGDWAGWSKSLSSQMLSKQTVALARKQLGEAAQKREDEFNEIQSLTNPTVKKKLLMSFADNADSAAVHLKAAALPRQSNKVILPVPSLKQGEIFAPGYENGETVALIRHPHGGIFEIPELTVNNRNQAARKQITTSAIDAVGIHPKTAEQLSGADFDGDTVLVIPNSMNGRPIKTSKALAGLKDFNPQTAYPAYEGMPKIKPKRKQALMGQVSNLITDMTIKGANQDEIAAAVRHSMVVIDAEKHNLNYRQSEKDNGIKKLKEKYQGKSNGGASTIVSRASSDARVPDFKPRPMSQGGPIDPKTGRLMYVPTGETNATKMGGQWRQDIRTPRLRTTSRMSITDDARTLSSGTPIEEVYAAHANRMKDLGNRARKEAVSTPPLKYSPSARKAYAPEVASLRSKLDRAYQNKPLERRAQILANAEVKAKVRDNPPEDADSRKKIESQALTRARSRTGAGKDPIIPTPREWEAIQSGAVSNSFLEEILNNTDLTAIKELATPKARTGLSTGQLARARAMLNGDATQAEVARALGVSVSTLSSALRS